ncbi:RRXRR domain-containing protein [Streptomyces virginiae]|uniref:RRXRR domain-containing protein n=1 Tax=Streptomyces virginiae TaxID=1961 RepID=UPI00366942D4
MARRAPFTIRLRQRTRADSAVEGVQLRLDPGSKATGIALTDEHHRIGPKGRVVVARRRLITLELRHRGQQIDHVGGRALVPIRTGGRDPCGTRRVRHDRIHRRHTIRHAGNHRVDIRRIRGPRLSPGQMDAVPRLLRCQRGSSQHRSRPRTKPRWNGPGLEPRPRLCSL